MRNLVLSLLALAAIVGAPLSQAKADAVFTVATFGIYLINRQDAPTWTGACFEAAKADPLLIPLCPLAFVLSENGPVMTKSSKTYLAEQGLSALEISKLETEGQNLLSK
jgi:hypothetical protein